MASAGRFAPRAFALALIAALGAAMLASPGPVERALARLRDLPLAFAVGKAGFDGVLVVDAGSKELAAEAQAAGLAPYRRDTYGEITRYLAAEGARAVAFNMTFPTPGPGDAGFARRLGRNVVLAGVGSSLFARPDGVIGTAVTPASVMREPPGLARAWTSFELPTPTLLEPAGVRVGIVNYEPDRDRRVHRQPMLHTAGGTTLPSLPLAVLLAESSENEVTLHGHRLLAGGRSWPLTDGGDVILRFPSNAADVPVVSLHRLALAATGLKPDASLDALVHGRAVFIGNASRDAGPVARTPAGEFGGVQLAALAYTQLRAGAVASPPRIPLDLALLLVALAPGIGLLGVRQLPGLRSGAVVIVLPLALIALAGITLGVAGIGSNWTFAMLAGVVGIVAALAWQVAEARAVRRRRRYERMSIEESNRLKTEFLNHLTHELRTPLTAIMGFNKINQFTDELGKDARIANSAVIARNCEHLLALINNNLDLAKMEAGQLAIVRSPEDPEQIFRDVLATMRALAADKKLELRYVKRTRLPDALLLDAFRLRQVLINLMGNAVKFTTRGSVDLCVAWHVAALEIEVRDTGPGIAAEALERIWQPFKQADLTVGRRFGGTGLGLAISRKLVEMMGGEIGIESQPGNGTTFRVRLPSEAVQPRAQGESVPPATLAANRERLSGRVLLADDNEDLRSLVILLLRNLGLAVKAVENGLIAVETAVAEEVDVILMDMEMPVMNGYEAVHVLRTRGYTGTIFGLTAHQEGPEVARAILSGCDAVLTKPVSLDSLKAALTPVLERSRAVNPTRTQLRAANNG